MRVGDRKKGKLARRERADGAVDQEIAFLREKEGESRETRLAEARRTSEGGR